jgi:hypothetical protein
VPRSKSEGRCTSLADSVYVGATLQELVDGSNVACFGREKETVC